MTTELSEGFAAFALDHRIQRALVDEGYETPTEIQAAAIPQLLEGRDLLASAQTGTGKTAAFSLPLLHRLANVQARPAERGGRPLRALILAPTRELALQIDESLKAYGRYLTLKIAVVLGGVSMGAQIRAMERRPDVLVATPGRLMDLMERGYVSLRDIEIFVLDEADRMLDMGFIHAVRFIASKVPAKRQTMFFSATLTDDIAQLAGSMLHEPVRIAVTPPASVSVNIEQQVLFVEQTNKRELLSHVLRGEGIERVLVFTRTKHRADRILRQLTNEGIKADAIHSNKNQNARQRALKAFDDGHIKVLVATDIVARGIDVDGISHVINFELPDDPESYVHRIGRTARAGNVGVAISFCDAQEVALLRSIERLTKTNLTANHEHDFHAPLIAAQHERLAAPSGTRPSTRARSFGPRGRGGRGRFR